jgi:hypothetical protein
MYVFHNVAVCRISKYKSEIAERQNSRPYLINSEMQVTSGGSVKMHRMPRPNILVRIRHTQITNRRL